MRERVVVRANISSSENQLENLTGTVKIPTRKPERHSGFSSSFSFDGVANSSLASTFDLHAVPSSLERRSGFGGASAFASSSWESSFGRHGMPSSFSHGSATSASRSPMDVFNRSHHSSFESPHNSLDDMDEGVVASVMVSKVTRSNQDPNLYLLEVDPLHALLMDNKKLIVAAIENGLNQYGRGSYSIVSHVDLSQFEKREEFKSAASSTMANLMRQMSQMSVEMKPSRSAVAIDSGGLHSAVSPAALSPSTPSFVVKADPIEGLGSLMQQLPRVELRAKPGTSEEKMAVDFNQDGVKALNGKQYNDALGFFSVAFLVLFSKLQECESNELAQCQELLATVLSNISSVLRDNEPKNIPLAKQFIEKCIEIRGKVLGVDHVSTVKAKEKLVKLSDAPVVAQIASDSSVRFRR